jgi:hypothetical protein
MSVIEEMKRLTERYANLESAKAVVEDLLYTIEMVSLPSGIEGSHHSEMEWNDTLEQIVNEMQEIENKIR